MDFFSNRNNHIFDDSVDLNVLYILTLFIPKYMTCTIPDMTYNVFGGTLSLTQSINIEGVDIVISTPNGTAIICSPRAKQVFMHNHNFL